MKPVHLPSLVTCLLALVAPSLASAQVQAPRPVDDIDIPAPRPPAPPAEPTDDPATAGDDSEEEEEEVFVPGRSNPSVRPESIPPRDRARLDAGPSGGGDAGQEPADAGATSTSTEEPRDRQSKPIIPPPPDGAAQLSAAFVARQKAIDERSPRTMLEAERRIEALRDELGLENLFAFSNALSHQAEHLLGSDAPEALRRALLSAELSPDSPYAQWTAARTALHDDPLGASRWLHYVAQALQSSWREPRWRMAFLAEAALVALVALAAAGALTVLLIFARHARYFFHDFRHLFPDGVSAWQTTPLALLLLAQPLLLGVGAYALIWAMALAGWGYMRRSERWVVGAALGLFGILPFAGREVGQRTAFAGTRAEAVWLVERGASEPDALEALRASTAKGEAFPVLFALGREERRRAGGQAVSLLRRASQLRPDSVEAAVEFGNALLLSGDLDGAGEAYQRAAAIDPGRSEPAFNLARLFARKGQEVAREEAGALLARAREYTRQAIDLDPRLGPRLSEPDYRANRLLAAAPLPVGPMLELAAEDASGSRVGLQVASRLFGPLRYRRVPVAAALSVFLLVVMGVLFGALRPCTACSKCGRPVCHRCDAEIVGPGLCGQCLHVFALRGAVDPPARLSKELGIKRFHRRREIALKTSSLVAGAAHVLSGQTLVGALMLLLAFACGFAVLFSRGVVPAPAGEPSLLLRVVPAALVALALVALSVRYAFSLFRPGPTKGP